MKTLGGIVAAIAVALLLAIVAASPSDAARKPLHVLRGPFDGLWSVTIFTRDGPCDASYRYPARIIGRRVMQAEADYSYDLTGIVTRNGGISVTVSRGGQSATGYGRLAGARGVGWWRTGGGQCSGVWSAIRRG
jgi:hypothetical protein